MKANTSHSSLVPFFKYRQAARIVRQFRAFQGEDRRYVFQRHAQLYLYLIRMPIPSK